MKASQLSKLGILAALLLVGMGGVAVVRQGQTLSALGVERDRLRFEEVTQADEKAGSRPPVVDGKTQPLGVEERLELMTLRRKVTELSDIKRRTARVTDENTALRGQLANVSHRLAKPFPPGWLKRAAARNRGFSTPEAAFETWVWSVAQRDQETLFASVVPEMRERLANNLAHSGPERLWKSVERIPGFLIRKVTPIDATQVELSVEIAPGMEGAEITARLVDCGWRMEL